VFVCLCLCVRSMRVRVHGGQLLSFKHITLYILSTYYMHNNSTPKYTRTLR